MCTIIINGLFDITSYKLLVVKINENVGVRESPNRLNAPVAMGRDGTKDPTIPDTSSDRLFDKKTFDYLLHPRVSKNVILQSPLTVEFQFRAPP